MTQLIDSHISHTTKPSQAEKDDDSVFMCLLSQVDGDRKLTTHEIAQAIFIGNESLLSNLSFLLYYMIENPHCVQALRAELDTLDTRTYGHQIWRDPKVSQLPYLVSVLFPFLSQVSHFVSIPPCTFLQTAEAN